MKMIDLAKQRFGPDVDFRPTSGPWHGVELAEQAAREGFQRVVAAGGDGTVHEVANGLLQSGNPDVALSVIPIGSMNDFGFTSGMNRHWETEGKCPTEIVRYDVGRVQSPGRSRYFVNSIGIGFTGFVTFESTKIKRLRGLLLYSLALFRAVYFHFGRPETHIELDGQSRDGQMLTLSVFLGQREGGFPLIPNARPDDGYFDYLFAGKIRWWEVLRYFPAILTGTLPQDHPELKMSRCQSVKLKCSVPLCVHTDGELYCVPQELIDEFELELLPNKLAVEVCPQFRYGAK